MAARAALTTPDIVRLALRLSELSRKELSDDTGEGGMAASAARTVPFAAMEALSVSEIPIRDACEVIEGGMAAMAALTASDIVRLALRLSEVLRREVSDSTGGGGMAASVARTASIDASEALRCSEVPMTDASEGTGGGMAARAALTAPEIVRLALRLPVMPKIEALKYCELSWLSPFIQLSF